MATRKLRTRLVRTLRNGQITIPAEFRKQLGLDEHSLLRVTLDDGELRIRPVRVSEEPAGSPWLKELYDLFTPWREIALKGVHRGQDQHRYRRGAARGARARCSPELR